MKFIRNIEYFNDLYLYQYTSVYSCKTIFVSLIMYRQNTAMLL